MPVPLVGAERVAKALIGWGRQARERGFTHRAALVNGDPGLVLSDRRARSGWPPSRSPTGVVVAVRSILNPDKLAHVAARSS